MRVLFFGEFLAVILYKREKGNFVIAVIEKELVKCEAVPTERLKLVLMYSFTTYKMHFGCALVRLLSTRDGASSLTAELINNLN